MFRDRYTPFYYLSRPVFLFFLVTSQSWQLIVTPGRYSLFFLIVHRFEVVVMDRRDLMDSGSAALLLLFFS